MQWGSGADVGKYLAPVASVSQVVQSAHPRCLGSPPPLAEQPHGLGRGLPLPPPPLLWSRLGTALPAVWGGPEGTPRGSARSRGRRSGSSEVPTPCSVGWECFCPRIRSLLEFVISLLLLQTQKTAKMQIFVEVKFCVVSGLHTQNFGSGPFLWSVSDSILSPLGTIRCFGDLTRSYRSHLKEEFKITGDLKHPH